MLVTTPPSRARRTLPWRVQVVVSLVLLLVAVMAVALAASMFMVRAGAEEETARRALDIARAAASDPRYATWIVTDSPRADGPAQEAAESVRRRTGALYVVITDARGVRFSHPNPSLIGQVVSTDPSVPLAGGEVTAIESGTLGPSARGKTPLRDAAGAVVGSVSVGVPMAEVDAVQGRLSIGLLWVGGAALVGGMLALGLFWRRLRKATHGLEPDEMADLLREHTAVLRGALEGVVAVDASGRLRVYNDAARRYLGAEVTLGGPAASSGLPEEMVDLLVGASASRQLLVAEGRVLEVRRLPVEHQGRNLGSVVVLRDRTDLDDLGRELKATTALTDALRAQTHEHTNRLHALAGLLQLGHAAEAQRYLADLAGAFASSSVEDPYLAGLLAGKQAAASQQGVTLRVSEATWAPGRLEYPLDTVTVVGNLVDNAARAAALGARRPPWVEVTLLADASDLVVHVIDSGDGVSDGHEEAIFADGWTTKGDLLGTHGVGLALARVTARRRGGDVRLAASRGEDHGAAFSARLAGAFTVDGRSREALGPATAPTAQGGRD